MARNRKKKRAHATGPDLEKTISHPLELTSEELHAQMEELTEGSDRTIAVFGGSMVEWHLRRLMETFILHGGRKPVRPNFKALFNGPLGTFSARIEIAYAFGVISEDQWWDMTIIRATRNEFAHSSYSRSFQDEDIAKWCAQFRGLDEELHKNLIGNSQETRKAWPPKEPRWRFIFSVLTQSIYLSGELKKVKGSLGPAR